MCIRDRLNVKKEKTSILNPIQHIKLNQQLTTVTEEIEELKSKKEQLIFQAQCSTDKDMTNLSKKYDQMNNNLDILDSHMESQQDDTNITHEFQLHPFDIQIGSSTL